MNPGVVASLCDQFGKIYSPELERTIAAGALAADRTEDVLRLFCGACLELMLTVRFSPASVLAGPNSGA